MAQSDSGLIRTRGLATGDGSDPIDRYVHELRAAMRRDPDSDDAVEEIEDHLTEAANKLIEGGLEPVEAERKALERFGSAALVARAFAARGEGVVMPTTFTRRAGLAGVGAVLMAVAGILSFTLTRASTTLSAETGSEIRAYTFDPFMVAAAGLFLVFVIGLRKRHGDRFGAIGNASLILILASPILAIPFGYGVAAALIAFLALGFTMLSVALFRATVLPRRAVAVFGLGLPASVAIGALGPAISSGVDTSAYMPLGLVPFSVGLIWMGWTMWLERTPLYLIPPKGGLPV